MRNHKLLQEGFTLIEILIALFVFTIFSMLAIRAIENIFASQNILAQHIERLAKLQMTLVLLSRDINQIVDRSIIDENGAKQAVFMGSHNYFICTRGGYINPNGQALRSTLQRVEYQLKDNHLDRISWSLLDRLAHSPSLQRTLLTNVSELQFSYLDSHNQFYPTWPPAMTKPTDLPKAIRVLIRFNDMSQLTQLYPLAGQTFHAQITH